MEQAAELPNSGRPASVNIRLYFALSRTPHGLLDMATPAMAALLYLGHFPPLSSVIIGLITAFAGYTAVYALNDIVDYKVDSERLRLQNSQNDRFDVDGLIARHPIAQGKLPYRSALYWFGLWALIALAGAWWLNPVCALIFIVSSGMEILYCKLLKITHLKIVPSVIVKVSGGLAGVFAVVPYPDPSFLALLAIWLAAWEVGGQNIANDIIDTEDDRSVAARTTTTVLGINESVFFLLVGIAMAVPAAIAIYWQSGAGVGPIYLFGAVLIAWKLLLSPARRVYSNPSPENAAELFNSASYMPGAFLLLVVLSILLPLK
jgi:4-hydroxybenzoate polyprenyltransferase